MSRSSHQFLFDLAIKRAKKALLTGGISAAILAILFISAPEIDLSASRLFFRATENPGELKNGFWLSENGWLQFANTAVDQISRVVLIALLAILLIRLLTQHQKVLTSAIVSLALILGPVVMVNGVFKDHWDRARPRQIQEFGGDKVFSPAWVIADQCERNCSFTSGHAAAGFSFVVLHFIARTNVWLWISLAVGALVGGIRVAAGAHFLSDVVFSFFLVYWSAALAALFLVRLYPHHAKSIQI